MILSSQKRCPVARWIVAGLALGLCALCARPVRANDMEETRRQMEMIMQRIRDRQSLLRALDGQAQHYQKSLIETEEFLQNKDKEQSYFENVVTETEAQIARWGEDIENEKNYQANREARLLSRVRALAVSAAPLTGRGSSRPHQTAAVLALRARCRQLALQTRVGRDSLRSYESELALLSETRDRYETFTQMARSDLTDVEQQAQRSRLSLERIEELKRQRATEIDALQGEHERMAALLQKLVRAEEERRRQEEATRVAQTQRQETQRAQTGSAASQATIQISGDADEETLDTTLEFTAPANNPVRALESGFVVFAGPYEGWETHVLIKHQDGMISSYRYLKDNAVMAGINVFKGMVIGWVGPLKGTSKTGVQVQIYREADTELIPIEPGEWGPTRGDPSRILLAPDAGG